MIEVRGLHKRFGAVVAVDEVSFKAEDGAVLGLLGPNGAGKTTTLRALCGLIVPDRGAAFIDGLDAATETLEARRRLGALPDARGLYPRLTALEHVRYFAELHGLRGAELESRCEAIIELLEMKPFANRRVEGFSGVRLGDEINRTQFQRPHRHFRAARGQRRHHHDGKRPDAHQLFQELQPVHARHLDVERQYVRRGSLQPLDRGNRVACDRDHRHVGLRIDGAAQQSAHHCRIIDHEDLDLGHLMVLT